MRRLRAVRPAWLAVVVAVAAALYGIGGSWRPFMTVEREVVTSTPSLSGIFQRNEIALPVRESACIAPVTFAPSTRRVQIIALGGPGAGPLRVVARAEDGSWRAEVVARDFGTGRDEPITVTLPSSPPSEKTGRVCLKNISRAPYSLVGTAEGRSDARAATTIDGVQQADASLTLLEERPSSLLSRVGDVLGHASTLTSGLVPTFVLWLVVLGLFAGVLVGLPFALFRALRDDEVATQDSARSDRTV